MSFRRTVQTVITQPQYLPISLESPLPHSFLGDRNTKLFFYIKINVDQFPGRDSDLPPKQRKVHSFRMGRKIYTGTLFENLT